MAAPAADLVVTAEEGIRWEEESYSATAGDIEIELDNESSVAHTLAIIAPDGSKLANKELSAAGKDADRGSFALTAGTYTIICTVPGHGNMKSDLIVS